MNQETLKMSAKERQREAVMRRYKSGKILLKEAAWEMRVSVRQAIRIKQKFEEEGTEGLIHLARDIPSNRGYSEEFRRKVLEIYRDSYDDFGPTLASEKMLEREGIEMN